MDGSRREIQRGEGSGRRPPSPSGDGAGVPWESHERPSEGLRAMFTRNEIDSAQSRIEHRRNQITEKIKGSYDNSKQNATNTYNNAIRHQEERGLNPAGGESYTGEIDKDFGG